MDREERKKRIASRGTDRMALITGRIQTLESNPLTMSSSFSTRSNDHQPTQHARSSSEPVPIDNRSLFSEYHHGGDDDKASKGDASENRAPDLQKHEQKEASFPSKPFGCLVSSLTSKEINSSIISSENTRVICSVAIAVLVVLSHVNVPRKVVNSKSFIAYRPLYVVLLTDVLVVAARLALYAQIKGDDHQEPKVDEDGHNFGGAIKLLEIGLVLHQMLRAVFIDCSFYLLIVVCGLSLV